jgi:hypothetical protein
MWIDTGVAPGWFCLVAVLAVFVWLPLHCWRVGWPAAVADRNRRTNPRFKHEY